MEVDRKLGFKTLPHDREQGGRDCGFYFIKYRVSV